MRLRPALALFGLGLLGAPEAPAQSIRWDPPGGSLAVGQTTALQLVCEDCQPRENPVPPKVDGLTLAFAGQSTNMSFVNGTYSNSVSYSYAALLTKKARAEIPAFDVETNKGVVHVAAARFEPGSATIAGTGQPLESAANSRLEASPGSVWAGEVFDVGYSIQAARSYTPDFGRGTFDWNPDPLVVEDWSAPEPFDLRSGGEPQTGFAYRTRAIAPKPGSFRLNPVNQLVNLSVGVSGFGFFQQRQYQQFSVTSSTATVQVRPLPPAPAGFKGAVGQFKFVSKIVPERASVGDPVTWTLELSGTGNWPEVSGLPARRISKDFQVIQPKAKRVPSAGKLFDAKLSEDVVLVPTRAGEYELPQVSFVFFNPRTGEYETATAPGATVVVTEEAPAGGPPPPAAGEPGPGAERKTPVQPPLPAGLPRDALASEGPADSPIEARAFAAALLAPLVPLVLFWGYLSFRKARRTDPDRPRRLARLRLAATVGRIGAEPAGVGPDRMAPLLLSWQRDAAELWGLTHAAPPPEALGDPAWRSLWEEADRTLYGAAAALPADWAARARAALGSKRVPRFALRRIFLARNLLPFLAALALLSIASPARADAVSSYRRGDFAGAERAWREAVSKSPADWAARYDLSVCLAQQNRWDEAAAQAAAAFVQNPADPAVRWQFDLACEKAGFVPAPLAVFLSPGAAARLARLASPAAWQRLLVGASCLAALALGILLAAAYGRSRRLRTAALALLVLAAALGSASAIGWQAYGAAAEPDCVLIWRGSTLRSIATEADSSQQTAPLAAGSMARATKSFLGWVRLDFENGQTGWVRREEAVWLWR